MQLTNKVGASNVAKAATTSSVARVAVPVVARQVRRASVVVKAAAAATAPVIADNATVDKCVNAVRFLAIDGVNKAKSGHPGLPMGCAPMSYVLFNEVMKFNPKNPSWLNRDRFVLSAGHGSMLQYALLHLLGYDSVSMDDLKSFRQWDSKTPGHPENFVTRGVEVTTGPLGQGICNAVGIAVAEAHLAARFNKPDAKVVDHHTYCILGDGCMMEGISNEASSLAAHWGLGKLICMYDDNGISIDGHTEISFTEDVGARYEALGWQVLRVKDGNTDYASLRKALAEAKACADKPTLIVVTTLIGYGSPNRADTHDVHGAPLGAEETAATRANLKWPYGEFEVPAEVYTTMRDSAVSRGAALESDWKATLSSYKAKYPQEAEEFAQLTSMELPSGWEKALPSYTPEDKGLATRQYSQIMLNALAPALPGLMGGSADLAPSNLTLMKVSGDFQKGQYAERNVRFGVREHAMGAICNGVALHNTGLIPYCATFFIFTDYMRSAMRMSALSQAGVVYVMTHDSIGLGEDGPTHQPVEHLASFRAMPDMLMYRPAAGNETHAAYAVAVANRKRPTTIALSRQAMPNLPGCTVEGAKKGGYVVRCDCKEGKPDVILLATGSELELAAAAADQLAAAGMKPRVVSLPCWEVFEEQGQAYKDSVLPPSITARVGVEAGSSFGWAKYLGFGGKFVGIDSFGASAPANVLYEKFGITVGAVVEAAKAVAKK